ncbi:hypothetical protein FHR83_006714 [Actinoplanes campanulatus]|uniref:Uncharacterized protein n=1 Tax=Actinoplanes campanulatus TaxID=113559 RepID=A0A7W5FHT8_9ACTN|nr:hypothetical protein [Actinoplanes campanulatus]MBB3099008.1 hypothetical protein [Actinoplanes campanulatus]GGN39471.1 hypothetical protein GCM10010109_67420 [Actinoplanes campanulatus]GID40168.1 hypothetical protein Aca09nite_66740 [Actinoplanes campanulatus]
MSLTSRITIAASAMQTAALDLGSASAQLAKSYMTDLTDGTSAGQANRIFHDTRTLAASSSEDIDLAGVLTDAFGSTITLARVKGLIIAAAAANTNNVLVGGASATQFVSWNGGATHTVTVRPGAVFALVAGSADATGYVTAAGSTDLLKIANSSSGTSVTYDIVVIGCSA